LAIQVEEAVVGQIHIVIIILVVGDE
jgi:hypothetical protein